MRAACADGSGRAQTRRRVVVAWLALFSLLLQFAATFAHFHPQDFAFSIGASRPITAAPMAQPSSGLPGLAVHDDCALCVSLQLVAASAMPGPVRLPPPGECARTVATVALSQPHIAPRHLLFQTRAPPLA